MHQKKQRVWELLLVFLKIGAFTFGGGYAMIPLIQREMVDNKKWISEKDILDIVAISESTPGPIAVNAATFVGYHVAGVAGATAATVGVVLPAFCIIACLAAILPKLEQLRAVQYAFWGIRVGVLALLLRAAVIAAARALAAALPAVHDLLIRLLNFHEFLFGLRGVRLAHVRIGVIPLAKRSIGLLHLVVAGRRGYA